jgi:hypothetical protein
VNDLSVELDKTGVRFSLPPPAAFGRLFSFVESNYYRPFKGRKKID